MFTFEWKAKKIGEVASLINQGSFVQAVIKGGWMPQTEVLLEYFHSDPKYNAF